MIATYNLNGIDLYKIVVPQILWNRSKVTEVIFFAGVCEVCCTRIFGPRLTTGDWNHEKGGLLVVLTVVTLLYLPRIYFL